MKIVKIYKKKEKKCGCTKWVNRNIFPSILLLFVVFQDRVSMDNSPKIHSVDKADLELRDLSASTAPGLGSEECATPPCFNFIDAVQLPFGNPRSVSHCLALWRKAGALDSERVSAGCLSVPLSWSFLPQLCFAHKLGLRLLC